MEPILLSPSEQGIVVFQLWPTLPYRVRTLVAFGLIIGGMAWQLVQGSFWPGLLLAIAGNLFLLVRGYNNNVDFGNFNPSLEWRPTTVEKVREVQKLDIKMKSWDRSWLDFSNPSGGIIFVLLLACLGSSIFAALRAESPAIVLVAVNAAVLLVPHWVTGTRSILTRPKLMLKIDAFLNLYDAVEKEIAGDNLQFSLLLEKAGAQEIPNDVRFRYVPKGAAAGFLGLQGQMAVNEVQGKSYLYFYVVAVAERGYGLTKKLGSWEPPDTLVLEPSDNDLAEVVVLRQKTTKKSGYSTDQDQIRSIFGQGLILAKRVACG